MIVKSITNNEFERVGKAERNKKKGIKGEMSNEGDGDQGKGDQQASVSREMQRVRR